MQVVIPYRPRLYQRLQHTNTARFQPLVWHRRAGKTVYVINKLQKQILTCPLPDARGMYVCPFLKQAKRVAWDYLVKFSAPIPGVEVNKGELTVQYPTGGRITLAGADNADAHRGIYLDHLVLDEVAQMSPRIWGEIFRPTLADRLGSGDFIGTPRGRLNLFYEMAQRGIEGKAKLDGWSTSILTANDTGVIHPQELIDARQEMSEDEYQQEFFCSWDASIKGAYYAKEMQLALEQKRITTVSYQDNAPVYTVCDLGMLDSFSIWYIQVIGNELHFIDYDEFAGMGLPAVIKIMREKPYIYGDHYAPHDINVRELGTGVTRLETARNLGVRYKMVRKIDVMDGIDAVRSMLKRCWFDKDKCSNGLEALRQYHSQYDPVKRIDSTAPAHDWSSHGADAMRYAAVVFGKGQQQNLLQEIDYTLLNRRAI